METSTHSMAALFQQLGLNSSETAITAFIKQHSPIAAAVSLADADFWDASQANLLNEMKQADADWVIHVDQLDALLRADRNVNN